MTRFDEKYAEAVNRYADGGTQTEVRQRRYGDKVMQTEVCKRRYAERGMQTQSYTGGGMQTEVQRYVDGGCADRGEVPRYNERRLEGTLW